MLWEDVVLGGEDDNVIKYFDKIDDLRDNQMKW